MTVRELTLLRPAWCLFALGVLSLASCSTVRTVQVTSAPPGARVLIDGVDSGLTTPTQVDLATSDDRYMIGVQRQGYNDVSREVSLTTDVDVMSAEEAFGRVLCAPCCLGLTLPALLTPVDVEKSFQPDPVHFRLDPEGQGLRLRMTPAEADIFVDGRMQRPIDGHILVIQPGDHELEIKATGYRSYRRVLSVAPQLYSDLEVTLEVEGQGYLLQSVPPGARLFVDDQYQGTIGKPAHRVRTTPGPHAVRVEYEGYRSFEDVLVVEADLYREETIRLELAGQGVLFGLPRGYRGSAGDPQILVDGVLRTTHFDEPIRLEPGTYLLELELPKCPKWQRRVQVEEGRYLEIDLDYKELRNPRAPSGG